VVSNAEPVLSVVLPVRDAEPYIADALNSLRHNADPAFEFIVIDDGSADGTSEVIADHAEMLPQMRVIRHDVAVGLADARNAGIAAARGRYVTFLDGDDWLAPNYLDQLVNAIDALDCDFVRVDHVQVKGLKRMVYRAPEARRGVVLHPRSGILPAFQTTMVDYPYAWAGIYRRELGALLRFPAGLHTAEDRPWIWRLHREARSYAVVSLAGVFYRRQVANSLTQTGDSRQLHFLDAFALVFEQVADEPTLELKAVRQYLAVLAHHLRLAKRMERPATRRMVAQARSMLAGIPADVLVEATPKDSRAQVLHPVLRAGFVRRRTRPLLTPAAVW
jgi:glycosyltransferase involved in cell wall biosynthesis